jgi:hypothetical protein
VSGFAGERRTGPVVWEWAPTSVTEMIANFGSTASSNVSATVFGGEFRVTLAAGSVLIR